MAASSQTNERANVRLFIYLKARKEEKIFSSRQRFEIAKKQPFDVSRPVLLILAAMSTTVSMAYYVSHNTSGRHYRIQFWDFRKWKKGWGNFLLFRLGVIMRRNPREWSRRQSSVIQSCSHTLSASQQLQTRNVHNNEPFACSSSQPASQPTCFTFSSRPGKRQAGTPLIQMIGGT